MTSCGVLPREKGVRIKFIYPLPAWPAGRYLPLRKPWTVRLHRAPVGSLPYEGENVWFYLGLTYEAERAPPWGYYSIGSARGVGSFSRCQKFGKSLFINRLRMEMPDI